MKWFWALCLTAESRAPGTVDGTLIGTGCLARVRSARRCTFLWQSRANTNVKIIGAEKNWHLPQLPTSYEFSFPQTCFFLEARGSVNALNESPACSLGWLSVAGRKLSNLMAWLRPTSVLLRKAGGSGGPERRAKCWYDQNSSPLEYWNSVSLCLDKWCPIDMLCEPHM